jgi:diacylglycerol kinase (ATP)
MTSRSRKIYDALTGTMRINPNQYSHHTSHSRFASLGYALAGWLYMLRWQKNTRLQAVATIIIMGVALWLQIDLISWAILITIITFVWLTEFMNAAVEAVVNLAAPDYHPMAQIAKDVASAAVLLSVVASVLVGLLILGPPLLAKLGINI